MSARWGGVVGDGTGFVCNLGKLCNNEATFAALFMDAFSVDDEWCKKSSHESMKYAEILI